MKKFLFVMLFALLAIGADAYAKTVKEATFSANMTCVTCKNKIEKTLKSEKGVIKSTADVASKTVTISYDADVTNESNIKNAIVNLGYTVDEVKDASSKSKPDAKKSGCSPRCSKSCEGSK